MDFVGDLFRGMVLLSFMTEAQHGCTVKEMAGKAADAHEAGLSSYGEYSRKLTGSGRSVMTDYV